MIEHIGGPIPDPRKPNPKPFYAFVYLIFGVFLGFLLGSFLYTYNLPKQAPIYHDPAPCIQAGGHPRRIATGDRYICYFN